MTDDQELLSRYLAERSQRAFAALVHRHLDLVYSAALRQVGGDTHLAQDVCQTVFIDLARKASALENRASLCGWLYTSARFAAAKIVRAERRRRSREEIAHHMQHINENTSESWETLRPLLDDAMHTLSARDREAVLLRYFHGNSFAVLGAKLDLSETAARLRTTRALEKLRQSLRRRGISSSITALAAGLGTSAVSAAPATLAPALISSAATSGTVFATTLAIIAMNKLNAALVAAVTLALTLAVTHQLQTNRQLNTHLAHLRNSPGAQADVVAHATSAPTQAPRRAGWFAPGPRFTSTWDASPWSNPRHWERESLLFQRSLDAGYAGFFRSLPPHKNARLRDLLVEKGVTVSAARDLARRAGLRLGGRRSEILAAAAAVEIEQQLHSLLGETDFQRLASFERTLTQRRIVLRAANQLEEQGSPLSDAHIDELTTILTQYSPAIGENLSLDDYAPVIERAQRLLSPEQASVIAQTFQAQATVLQLMELNRAAAQKGLLTLNAGSAAHYPQAKTPAPR